MEDKDFINTESENSGGNKGNRGKFSDRLKKIRRDRLKRRKHAIPEEELEEENILIRGGRNVLKIALALPSVVYTNIKTCNVYLKENK